MAKKYNIVTTGEGVSATREMMITFLNTGATDAPVWSAMGAKVTDSSVEYDWSIENNTDILGNAYTTAKTAQMSQSFSGNEVIAGDSVMNHLVNLAVVQKDAAKLVNQDCLVVHLYLQDDNGKSFAERYPASAVVPTTIGGEGGAALVTDIDVTYGGARAVGTAEKTTDGIQFTADSDAAAAAASVKSDEEV